MAGQVLDSNTGLLLKINSKGNFLWEKRFPDKGKFTSLQVLKNTSIIIAGAKQVKATGLVKDSSFIIRTDTSGNEVWCNFFCADIGLRHLELVDNKIAFLVNKYDSTASFPNSSLFFVNQDGMLLWEKSLNKANTNIEFGVKAMNLKTDKTKKINVLVQSHNDVYLTPHFIQLDTFGNKQLDIAARNDSLFLNNSDKVFFLQVAFDLMIQNSCL